MISLVHKQQVVVVVVLENYTEADSFSVFSACMNGSRAKQEINGAILSVRSLFPHLIFMIDTCLTRHVSHSIKLDCGKCSCHSYESIYNAILMSTGTH